MRFQASTGVIVLTKITGSFRWVFESSFSPTLHVVPGEYLSYHFHQHYMRFQVSTWVIILTNSTYMRFQVSTWVVILTNSTCGSRWVLESSFSPTLHAVSGEYLGHDCHHTVSGETESLSHHSHQLQFQMGTWAIILTNNTCSTLVIILINI